MVNGVNYFDVAGKAQRQYGKALEPLCKKTALTRNEVDVLLFLCNNPGFDRAADIVNRRGITKSHVSMAVKSLEEKGLLERETDQTDRRTVRLRLTEQGLEIAREGREIQQALFRRLYAGVTREEFRVWNGITEKIAENVEKMEE